MFYCFFVPLDFSSFVIKNLLPIKNIYDVKNFYYYIQCILVPLAPNFYLWITLLITDVVYFYVSVFCFE